MGDRSARDDQDVARSHRNPDPLGPNDQPEGETSESRNPSSTNMDRPLVGRSDSRDEKITGPEDDNGNSKA